MNKLLKLLQLSQKSGDRFVIYNPENPDNSWVAISLEEYEKLVNSSFEEKKIVNKKELTEEEPDDKINLDKKVKDEVDEYDLEKIEENVNRPVYSNNDSSLNSIKDVIEEKKSGWKISNKIKNSALEINE
jgi:hypothetical protein